MVRSFLRRRLLVDWKLQGSLCAHSLLYGCLVLVTLCVGIFLPLLWNLDDPSRGAALEEQAIVMLYMHERFWFLALLCFCIVVLGAIKFSHRIAGPLVRYKRNLRLLAKGQLPSPLRTRRGDYLKEEVRCLNEAVVGIEARVMAIAEAQTRCRRELRTALAGLPEVLVAAFEPVLAASRDVERRLAAFERVDTGDDKVPEAVGAGAEVALAGPAGEGF